METAQIISWIFLATALASQVEPAKLAEISNVADGINHAIPTHKELQTAINWLIVNDMIKKQEAKYSLTEKGNIFFENATKKHNALLNIWHNLEREIKNSMKS